MRRTALIVLEEEIKRLRRERTRLRKALNATERNPSSYPEAQRLARTFKGLKDCMCVPRGFTCSAHLSLAHFIWRIAKGVKRP